jgi:hypothetical protein
VPARVTCLVCYRNLLRAEYGQREALATSRRCLWDWEHPPVVEPTDATGVSLSGPTAIEAIQRSMLSRAGVPARYLGPPNHTDRAIADAEIDSVVDMLGAEEEDGEPRPAS